MEIRFPLEFIVEGRPVSLQVKRAQSRVDWQDRVRRASTTVLPENHYAFDGPIAVTLFYFPTASMAGDIDNIVKPVLDALNRHIYLNDRQVERVWVQKFEPGRPAPFSTPTETLREAMAHSGPLLYVRLSNDPTEGLS